MVSIKFSYEDLLSGDPILVEGIGHFRSPLLKELKPSGAGMFAYTLYLNLLSWDKEDLLTVAAPHQTAVLEKAEKISVFDSITLLLDFRTMLNQALSFFLVEEVVWEEKAHKFITLDTNEKLVGEITRINFDNVRDMCLQLNYINLDRSASSQTPKCSSKKVKALWDKAQEHLKKQSKSANANKNYCIGNIVSKLCAAGVGYTFHNIYDLTVYQLYDCFFQYGYLRAMDLNENAFANNGGKKFNIQDWLKPIQTVY